MLNEVKKGYLQGMRRKYCSWCQKSHYSNMTHINASGYTWITSTCTLYKNFDTNFNSEYTEHLSIIIHDSNFGYPFPMILSYMKTLVYGKLVTGDKYRIGNRGLG